MARSTISPSSSESVTTAVADAVADTKGVEPVDLEIVFEEHIDTEAVNRLATHDTASWTLSFELPEHTVTVTSDGEVLVDGHRKDVATV